MPRPDIPVRRDVRPSIREAGVNGAFHDRLRAALTLAQDQLWRARNLEGHWSGELSSSALSTATAVCALATLAREAAAQPPVDGLIARGLHWLAEHANSDGGWGDTVHSLSNISTTTLGWAAFGSVPGADAIYRPVLVRAEQWLAERAGGTKPEQLAPAIIQRYGEDRTFSAPILTMCAIAGRLGAGAEAWRHVWPLPFELAMCPHGWFATIGLPVVSYALPALIAIGQARHFHLPSRNPLARLARRFARGRTLRLLREIQPASGGYLEAAPLTSFVVMSLAASGQARHPVAQSGQKFLAASARPDGSWPIDTNLATWLTTLAVNALVRDPQFEMPAADRARIRSWLLRQQYRSEHPYTHAPPGGWAWTDLPGGVPDADDTAGALLALRHLGPDEEIKMAARLGLPWLLQLQNKDGGIPTFCRGWGKLPFDRSSPDLTAHAMRAWTAWRNESTGPLQQRLGQAVSRAAQYLAASQGKDGWAPLWFGSQFAADESNLTYGNARVLEALHPDLAPLMPDYGVHLDRAVQWLLVAQDCEGAWGGCLEGPPSIEETALAVEALAGLLVHGSCRAVRYSKQIPDAVQRGAAYLMARIEDDRWTAPSPIGFYFAKLWYFERLYPLIFTVGALGQASRCAL
jgi:squalene-hopene/tetraprenyl-beta-curcumene cyclase